MAKIKSVYICSQCGYESPKWYGKCPTCGEWNTMEEEIKESVKAAPAVRRKVASAVSSPYSITEITTDNEHRYDTGCGELNRVLGGGIVKGSLILLGGDPGIGKSTIVLDASMKFSENGIKVLYVSGEESEAQTAMRAKRLGGSGSGLLIMTATDLAVILAQAQEVKPALLVIDSIQTMYNAEFETAAGSVGQVRECTAKLLRFAKSTGIAVLIIGHVTKEGNIAGPRLLEHMVDVVLQFEGERSYAFRVLRALKNRFGSTNESGIFSMEESGLKEVANPSGLFLEKRASAVPGSVVCACLEGNRPLLVEMQALVARTPYGMPRRTAVGFDYNRVNMLLAILEKRLGMDFGTQDVYVNVVGGARVTEPAADLAVIAAIVSSYRNKPVMPGILAVGEVGLTGEVRRVGFVERRIKEAQNLGFQKFVTPTGNLSAKSLPTGIIQVNTVEEALAAFFEK